MTPLLQPVGLSAPVPASAAPTGSDEPAPSAAASTLGSSAPAAAASAPSASSPTPSASNAAAAASTASAVPISSAQPVADAAGDPYRGLARGPFSAPSWLVLLLALLVTAMVIGFFVQRRRFRRGSRSDDSIAPRSSRR